jgi:hypothetical protein
MSIPQGWQCPKCGKIHSPSALSCNACSKNSMYDLIVAPEKMPLSWAGSRRGHGVWELVRLFDKHARTGHAQCLFDFRAMLHTLVEEEKNMIRDHPVGELVPVEKIPSPQQVAAPEPSGSATNPRIEFVEKWSGPSGPY